MQVSSTGLYYSDQKTASRAATGIDKNAFLKILAMQMSYQDPMSSADPSEYVSQLAQFSALEQMQNLSESFERLSFLQAAGMIGRNVVLSGENGEQITGTVEKVRLAGNDVEVMVNGSFYNLGRGVQVG
ncbi:MAG: hypothetical protein K6T80_07445 [Firmicutes bacterium]|nr:hypothetical protein [Bacillota bacterium]